MGKVLIIEDEVSIAELERDYLEISGFEVDISTDGKEGLGRALNEDYELILLDLMLPGVDGYEICKQIRAVKEIPIIMVSAKKNDIDKIRGLGLGADDYITKPFLPEELILRIAAVLRRTCHLEEKEQGVQLGESLVSIDAGTVIRQGEKLSLTAKELALFSILYRNKGKIVTTDTLCDALWPDGNFGLESSLLVHMRHLREKIEKEPSKPVFLLTVRGLGYKLEIGR